MIIAVLASDQQKAKKSHRLPFFSKNMNSCFQKNNSLWANHTAGMHILILNFFASRQKK